MYTPMEVRAKSTEEIRIDLERVARAESGTPDERIRELAELCDEISQWPPTT